MSGEALSSKQATLLLLDKGACNNRAMANNVVVLKVMAHIRRLGWRESVYY